MIWSGTLFCFAGGGVAAQELEEIVVTAQKRTQSLREVPVSVGTLDSEALSGLLAARTDIGKLSGRIPSLRIETSNGRLNPRIYIRGLGNIDFDINASQPISLVYDDVVLENPAAKAFPLFDLQRVEVLRGPQGSLFGRNTTGGIVKLDSRRPTAETNGYVTVGLGERGFRTLESAIGGSIGEGDLTGRASVFMEGLNNWIDNVAPGFEEQNAVGGYDEYAMRLQLAFRPSEQLSALINIHGRSMKALAGTQFRANILKRGQAEFIDGFDREKLYQDAHDDSQQRQKQIGVIGTIKREFEMFNLVFVAGWHSVTENFSRGDIDGGYGSVFGNVFPSGPEPGIPFDAQTSDGLQDHAQNTQEVRLESIPNETGFQYRIGLYRFSEEMRIETLNYDSVFVPGTINGRVIQDQQTDAWALFGTFDYLLSPRTDLTVGWRYSSDSKELVVSRHMSPLSFLGVGPIGPLRTEPGDNVLTGDVAIVYEHSERTNIYARLARGHRSPSIQGRLLFQDSISIADTELNTSFETGLKGRFWDGRVRSNLAVYRYSIQDQQLTRIGGEANINELINADLTQGMGIEVELDVLVSQDLYVQFGLSHNRTKIVDSDLTINGCGSASLLYGCSVTDPIASNGEYSIDGNSLYNAPVWMGNLALHFDREMAFGRVFVHAELLWQSEFRFTLYESLENRDEGIFETGIRVGYRSTSGRTQVALVGKNIFNDVSLVGTIDFNNLTGFVNEPPMWLLEYRRSFGSQ